ncbi:recombinase family protein [Lactobacillus gallinarum]|uniref:recombinase family protein n=1 Tax=Lactobacillus gallinarum TaxID=52242 RepID=UPI00195B0FFD|nr:recombinase family protein [Lactobacillus gallinarum]MBM6973846.1 recombinase family protein [Lactobacillus gallinarum]
MTVYGYARVSTRKQDLSAQIDDLKKAGATVIFREKYTGTTAKRPEFDKLMNTVTAGDTVIVTKLDRLARNTEDALKIVKELRSKNVTLNIKNLGVIDNNPSGNLIFTIFSAFAQFERDLIIARTEEGKEWAREHKANYNEGRPLDYDYDRIKFAYDLRKRGYTISEITKNTGISKTTLYRRFREYNFDYLKGNDNNEQN